MSSRLLQCTVHIPWISVHSFIKPSSFESLQLNPSLPIHDSWLIRCDFSLIHWHCSQNSLNHQMNSSLHWERGANDEIWERFLFEKLLVTQAHFFLRFTLIFFLRSSCKRSSSSPPSSLSSLQSIWYLFLPFHPSQWNASRSRIFHFKTHHLD